MTKIRRLLLLTVAFPAIVFAQAMKSTLALQGGSTQINGVYVSHTIGHVVMGGSFSIGKSKVVQGFEYMLKYKRIEQDVEQILTKNQHQFFITPNPFMNYITIQGESIEYPLEVHVFDVLGRLIIRQKINDLNENKIDVSQLSQSKYFVQLNTRIKKFSTVLIKK